jgi:hypothetical protein
MAIIQADASHPQTKEHDGKPCTRVRAVTIEDGEAFDVARGKTVVRLDDDREIVVWNTELQPSARDGI